MQVSGEEREGGIRGTGVGIFECEGEWVIIQDREKGGISKNVANPHLPFNLHVNVGDSTFFSSNPLLTSKANSCCHFFLGKSLDLSLSYSHVTLFKMLY